MNDLFCVEIFSNGWEVAFTCTSWLEGSRQAEIFISEGYQVRLTSPQMKGNELVRELQKIHEEHSSGLTTPQDFADRVVSIVCSAI